MVDGITTQRASALLLLVAGLACSGVDASDSNAPFVFTMASRSEVIIGWDPATYRSNEVKAMPLMYEGLTRFNPETGEAEPLLAESYTVQAWSRGDDIQLRLAAYDGYWGGWQGRRYRHVVFRVVSESATAAQLLRAGKVSWVEHMTPQLWASFAGDRDVKTVSTPPFENYLLFINTRKGALKDQRVRQAISYAVDYDGIAAMVVKSNLADLNVTVDARGLLWETLWAIARSPDPQNGPDMSIMVNWPDTPGPENWFWWLFRTQDPVVYNFSRYSNPLFDAMLAEARRLSASDRARSIERYRRLQMMLLEDAPVIFLGDSVYQRALLSSVGNFVENPIYPNAVFVWNLRPQP